VRREAFCDNFITLFEEDETPVSFLISSDEATFHMHGIVNKQNVFICGSENPDASVEFMLDLYGPFFLIEYTVIGMMCLDILELWLCRQLKEEFPGYSFFRQDGPPPDYHLYVILASKYSNYATLSKDLLTSANNEAVLNSSDKSQPCTLFSLFASRPTSLQDSNRSFRLFLYGASVSTQ
jgi:hypothetical protein